MSAKIEILEAWEEYLSAGKPEPSTLVMNDSYSSRPATTRIPDPN